MLAENDFSPVLPVPLPSAIPPMLVSFVDAGVLSVAEARLAVAIGALEEHGSSEVSGPVLLALGLAARAPRLGHTTVDLSTVAATVISEIAVDERSGHLRLDDLPWPEPGHWIEMLAASDLVSVLGDRIGFPDPQRPLVLRGESLTLQRYWAYERLVADSIIDRLGRVLDPLDPGMSTVLDAIKSEEQRHAIEIARTHALTVLVGGPGTGKTTVVAALLASMVDPGSGSPVDPSSIALAAPTGKAAARLTEALRAAALRLPGEGAARLSSIDAMTIHRLLGMGRSGARYHRGRRLPHDVVIVDESSMISLPLMARLLDAVRPDARVVIVGDPGQLSSVEAGTVLADLIASTHDGARRVERHGEALEALDTSVVALQTSHRFLEASGIGRLAGAVGAGDLPGVLETLRGEADPSLEWIPLSGDDPEAFEVLAPILEAALTRTITAAERGDSAAALGSLDALRVLCAHRRGSAGADGWNRMIESTLLPAGRRRWYPGRPVMVTRNDYRLDVFNGDIGVVIEADRPQVALPSAAGEVRLIDPMQIGDLETVYAMTIHKSQGSEFDHVVVVLPPEDSRLATRELLYTAVTRARTKVTVVGTEAMVTAAVKRRVTRASGLRDELLAQAETRTIGS